MKVMKSKYDILSKLRGNVEARVNWKVYCFVKNVLFKKAYLLSNIVIHINKSIRNEKQSV